MIGRRRLLAELAAIAAIAACSRRERASSEPGPPPPSPSPNSTSGSVELRTWSFDGPLSRAAVLIPRWGAPGAKWPVLVAFHGRGEAVKPPDEGVMGWPRDYALTRAFDRMRAPPLTTGDFEGFVEAPRLDAINRDLAARPFGGMIVACPHVPDMDPNGDEVAIIARFVREVLLPRVRAETPALAAPESTGIDGVSMGGAIALRVGLANADLFGDVGSLQPAITEDMAEELAELAKAARAKRPSVKLRLLTSHGDYFHDAIARTSEVWRAAGIDHDFADVPGPHDYVFNKGPGSIEMLFWHDRNLAR